MAHVLAKDLRDSVLQAALEGKITTTLESDTNPLESIKHFQKEKDILLQKKNMKDRNKFDSIKEEEILFEIPTTWQWIRINDIGIYKKGPFGSALTKGMFVPKNNESVKVYEQKNAIQKNWTLGEYYIKRDYYETKMSGFSVETGDIIVSCAGTIGETYIMPEGIETGIINQALMRMNIVPSVNIDYFMLVFEHILKEEARKNSGGTAIKNIPPFEVFKAMPIPLPPIEEQARIVARVDELMAKIDEYEKLEKELTELKEKFPEEMRDAILQAGITGRLAKQNNDEKVSTSILKNSKSSSEYELPDNWACIELNKIVNIVNGFTPLRSNSNFWDSKDVPWFTVDDIREQGHFINHTAQYISNKALSKDTKRVLPKNSVLLCCTASIGEYAYTNIELTTNQQFNGLVIKDECKNDLSPLYLYYYVQTLKRKLIDKSGATTFSFLSTKKLGQFDFPLPPIEEQQRIVEKLDKLLPMCNELVNLC